LACCLFAGVGVSLSGCGVFGSGKSDYEKFQETVAGIGDAIVDAGGAAVKEEKTILGFKVQGWTIDLSNGQVTDAVITKIIEASRSAPVLELSFANTELNDDQLAKLDAASVLVKTYKLDLSNTQITDKGLMRVKNAICLSVLNLKGTSATRDGAKRLADRKNANPLTPAPLKGQLELTI
jgi:hypothetical protein